MSGGHTSEKRWYRNQNPNGNEGVADRVQAMSKNVVLALLEGEEAYQEMLELFDFAGGTTQLVADQLFLERWTERAEANANAEELAMTTDMAAAITSIHELYEAMTNVVVVQEDRIADLRRMS